MSQHRALGCLAIVAALVPAVVSIAAHDDDPQGMAAGEIVARGFEDAAGITVDAGGAVVVSDRKAGTVVQLLPDGRRTVLLRRLDGPFGVTFDNGGGLLVAEEHAGRVLRRDPGGAIAIVAAGLGKPQWITAGPGGHVYVTAKHERILQLSPSGGVRTFATGLRGLEGLVVSRGVLYAAVRRVDGDRGRDDTEIVGFRLRPDGSAGPMQVALRSARPDAFGLAADRLGALVAAVDADGRGHARGGVIKQAPAGQFVALASTLRSPQSVAFEPAGHLLVVEGEPARQVRRFRAPAPPAVNIPAFTNESPVAVTGSAAPGALVHVFGRDELQAVASTVADVSTGAYALTVPLASNQETLLSLTATADGGRGLTSAPADARVVHDDHQPALSVFDPAPGVYTRDVVAFSARAEDTGSGVTGISTAWDAAPGPAFQNTDPAQPLAVSATLSTSGLAEGARTLTVTATDRAGNVASAALLVGVDRTPPETSITSGPSGDISERSATFVVAGTDLLSPTLEFSWRLDSGAWSPFAVTATAALSDLTQGEHRFEVKSRDLAGNEDPMPAVQLFRVRLLRLTITEPADGATVTGSSVLIRGTVEGGAGEVTVSAPLPPDIGGSIAAPVEGGEFALQVPADPASTSVTVTASDSSGATATASIALVFAPDGAEDETLDVWPPGGVAPLAVRVGVHGFVGVPISVDFDGDGAAEFEGEPDAENLFFTYSQPGIYVPVLRFTTPDGQVITQRGMVEVYDAERLEARLQAVWTGFRDSLRKGDIAAAVSFIAAERRGAWTEFFASLPPDAFADVDLVFTGITRVEVGYGGAQYEMVAERDGLLFSYAVWFQIDADGRWRLWRF